MRIGTFVVLAALVVLFAVFGWKAFGYLALFALLVVLFAVGSVAWALYRVRRRLEKTLEEAARRFTPPGGNGPDRGAGPGTGAATRPSEAARRGAIDVEGHVRKPRDGADDPDSLAAER